MKKNHVFNLIMLLGFGFSTQVYGQYTAIPDAVFEQFLIDQSIDTESTLNGQILTLDISSITSLDISYTSISNLTGIQDFTALTHLKASNVSISSLNVSGLTNLQDLDLSMSWSFNSLNVSGCTSLLDLDLRFTNLNALDLSTCTSLSTIDLYRSSGLHHLDVSGMNSITSIVANESDLQTLNVLGCNALSVLNIDETSISTLDLSNNPSIITLDILDTGLQSINLSNCVNFESIFLTECFNLSSINFTNTPSIKWIHFNQLSSQINTLDISDWTNLENLFLLQTSISSIDASNNSNLNTLHIAGSDISNLDLRNGNNSNITTFYVFETNLDCISVDDAAYSTTNWTNIENSIVFSNDCLTLSTDVFTQSDHNIFPNPSVDFISVSGLNQSTKYSIYSITGQVYDSGYISPDQKIEISYLSQGIYFLQIESLQTMKFIKK